MKRVFVDTNVVLDVLLQNKGVWEDSLRIFRLAETGQIAAYVSASSMTDIFYVASKKLSSPVARQAIRKLLDLFNIVAVDGADLKDTLTIPIADFEDALQVHLAKKITADALITRDIGGFTNVDIDILLPVEFTV